MFGKNRIHDTAIVFYIEKADTDTVLLFIVVKCSIICDNIGMEYRARVPDAGAEQSNGGTDMKKIIAINGSPRRNGNTARALNEVGIVGEDAK